MDPKVGGSIPLTHPILFLNNIKLLSRFFPLRSDTLRLVVQDKWYLTLQMDSLRASWVLPDNGPGESGRIVSFGFVFA